MVRDLIGTGCVVYVCVDVCQRLFVTVLASASRCRCIVAPISVTDAHVDTNGRVASDG